MRLKRDHQDVLELSEWQSDLQVVQDKYREALESYEINNLAMEKFCAPGAGATSEDKAVAKAMCHGELMQKEGLEPGYNGHVPEPFGKCSESLGWIPRRWRARC